ncbi:MAG: cyclic nucleotide-binding domain-containing protein [Actinomycetota bacterium]|nr:cyclic nucleotide-binding domain-containing protein [Actinomycetota bacterium]
MTNLDHLFRSHPFISTLSDGHITTLEGCGAAFISFEPGEKIVREGKDTDACFFIDDGDAALELYIRGAESRTILTVHAGDIVGWSWLFPPYRGAFDAIALTHVTALRVDAALLREAMEMDKAFGYEMMKRFCDVIVTRISASRVQLADVYGLEAAHLRIQPVPARAGHSIGR